MQQEVLPTARPTLINRLVGARTLNRAQITWWGGVAAATVLGYLIRIAPVSGITFPANDGGLFTLMAEEIRADGFRLPDFTAYNAGHIPFAYPPFGLYLAATLSALTPWSLLGVVRILPALLATAAILAFALIAREVLSSPTQRVVAVFTFALLPGTYQWIVMGGGLTRAPGMLFGLLTLAALARTFQHPSPRIIAAAAMFAGLTLLSHLEWTYFAAYSGAILFWFFSRSRRGIRDAIMIAGGAAIIASPWWVTVISRHGVMPFFYAATSRPPSTGVWATLLTGRYSIEPLFPIFAAVGLIGLLACLAERKYLLPLWFIAVFVIQPGGFYIYAAIPLALLVGVGIDRCIVPALHLVAGLNTRTPIVFRAAVLVVALIPILGSTVAATSDILQPLPTDDRTAMAWVSQNTPPDSRFVMFSAYSNWDDRTWEWFPVLANRVSLNTAQGYEWTPNFEARADRTKALYKCESGGVACLNSWIHRYNDTFNYVYIQKQAAKDSTSLRPLECCSDLEAQLKSAGYPVVYENAGVVILAHGKNP